MDKLSMFLTILFGVLLNAVQGSPITSCHRTPYPEVCNHYMGTAEFESKTFRPADQLTFYQTFLKVALDHAVETHRSTSAVDISWFDERAKSAWSDCLQLYQDTVHQLNKCRSSGSSPFDTQTWLSAAMTNQRTCQNGFVDFKLTSHLQYLPLNNVSELLSNSLAINEAKANARKSSTATMFSKQTLSRRLLSDEDFPLWVPMSSRKLLQSSGKTPKPDLVVAQDGSGNHMTVSEAVAASVKLRGKNERRRFVIYVKAGVYRENVEIKKSMKNIMIIGDGIDATIITGSRNVNDGSTTFRSATFAVDGEGFIARGLTFENSAGPTKHQAVALRSCSDFSVFYNCSFKGYQDTLYVHSHRQFYRNCQIYGTVDFIFGDAVAVLQNCDILVRKPMSHQKNTVTAQGRGDPRENTGLVIHNSRVAAAQDLGAVETYLGRPWRKYSRTVVMKTVLEGLVNPAGWLPWSGDFALSTLYYAEYMNTESGANTSGRVKWPGFHVLKSRNEAAPFSVGNFLQGNSWIPASGVSFDSGV